MSNSKTRSWIFYITILLAAGVYVLNILRLGGWIIDDAGISFAYARNLALGHGLVAQPGAIPIEGYSNCLWVLLLSLFFKLNLFDPVITPKVICVILVAMAFLFLARTIKKVSKHPEITTLAVLILLATCPPIIIWTASGLENGLTFLLSSLLLSLLISSSLDQSSSIKSAILLGVVTAMLAINRPDGILFFAAYPALLVGVLVLKKKSFSSLLFKFLAYLVSFLLLFCGFVLFRWMYFHQILPNTYYAKTDLTLFQLVLSIFSDTHALIKFTNLLAGAFNWMGWMVSVIIIILIGILIRMKRLELHHLIIFIMAVIPMLIYMILPADWMDERRFATPFFAPIYLMLILSFESVIEGIVIKRVAKNVFVGALLVVFIGFCFYGFNGRLNAFIEGPDAPLAKVEGKYVDKFDFFQSILGGHQESLLAPDIGALLYYSDLRIVDLGGLTNKTIANTLGRDQNAFYDYIFDVERPTFIHTQGWWSFLAGFEKDPRFRDDYEPISEYEDPWVLKNEGVRVFSGEYVRKDALKDPTWINEMKRWPE